MLAVQMGSFIEADEEGGPVGVGAGIGHREDSRTRVAEEIVKRRGRREGRSPQSEVFIWEFAAIDRLPATRGAFESLGNVKEKRGGRGQIVYPSCEGSEDVR
jgi:hypothetical protein